MTLYDYVNLRYGIQSELAEKLAVSPVLVHLWSKKKRQVPAERCLAIESATDGRVTCKELRPDVFGKPETAAA